VHAQQPAALRAGPPGKIIFYEIIDPIILDVIKILGHTRSIFASISLVQVFHLSARKFITLETISIFLALQFLAVFNLARQAGFHFKSIITPAARAVILVPYKCITQVAIDPAWGN
jgi:hypothetical protein